MKERADLTLELSLGADGSLPSEFMLFKAGLNRGINGDVKYTPRSRTEVAIFAADLNRDLVIDYEHASLTAKTAADPKKAGEAAGWFSVDAREDGVYATNVTWTDDGAALLKARKFRFFSPVFFYDRVTKEITSIINAALTANPATKGQVPLIASIDTQEKTMFKLATLFSLAADATEDAIASAASKVQDERQLLLAATGKATIGEASIAIAGWKKDSEQVAALSSRVSELEGVQKKGEISALIASAQTDGKVSPAQVPVLEKMGARSIDELKEFLSASPVIASVKNPAKEPAAGASVVVLSPEDKAIAAMLSVNVEDLAKTKKNVGPVVPVIDVTQKPTA